MNQLKIYQIQDFMVFDFAGTYLSVKEQGTRDLITRLSKEVTKNEATEQIVARRHVYTGSKKTCRNWTSPGP